MKVILNLIIIVIMGVTPIFAQEADSDKEDIQNVIQTAYVNGLQNNGDVKDILNGFHPGFNLLGVHNDMLNKYPIYSWIQSFEERKVKDPMPPNEDEKVTCNYLLIDITGNAAMAKIELVKNEKVIFTDYLQLYKFEEGWRIVSKIYYRH